MATHILDIPNYTDPSPFRLFYPRVRREDLWHRGKKTVELPKQLSKLAHETATLDDPLYYSCKQAYSHAHVRAWYEWYRVSTTKRHDKEMRYHKFVAWVFCASQIACIVFELLVVDRTTKHTMMNSWVPTSIKFGSTNNMFAALPQACKLNDGRVSRTTIHVSDSYR